MVALRVSSGRESTRTRDFLLAAMRPRSISSTLASMQQGGEVGHLGEDHAGVDVVADLEGLGVHPALGVVGLKDEEAGDGRFELHLGDAGLGDIDVGLGLVALAGEGGDLGAIGGGVQIDGGLLDFEFLLGDAVIDLAGFALEAADDLLFGGFQAGALDGELGVGEIGLVLLGGDFGLGERLIEGGLRLAEGGLLLHEFCWALEESNLTMVSPCFDGCAGRGHPGDAEVGHHRRVDLDGAFGLEFAAAADDDQEIALAGGRGREDGSGLRLAVAVDAGGGAADDGNEEQEAGPEAQAGASAGLRRARAGAAGVGFG